MKAIELYEPYKILVPRWWSTNPKYYPDNVIPHLVPKWWWHICRLMVWRYGMNHYTGFLVQKNKWTRDYHFTDDWEGINANHFASAMGTLGKIAKR